jgi:hypothetical protein
MRRYRTLVGVIDGGPAAIMRTMAVLLITPDRVPPNESPESLLSGLPTQTGLRVGTVFLARRETPLPKRVKNRAVSNLGRFAFSRPRFPCLKVLPTGFGLLEVINNARIGVVDFRQAKDRIPSRLRSQIKWVREFRRLGYVIAQKRLWPLAVVGCLHPINVTAIEPVSLRSLLGWTNSGDHESYFVHFCHVSSPETMKFHVASS